MPFQDYWPFVLKKLKNTIPPSNFKAWLTGLEFMEISGRGKKIILATPTKFSKEYIENKLQTPLREAINSFYPEVVHIELRVSSKNPKTEIQEDVFGEISEILNQKNTYLKSSKSEINLINGKNLNNLNPKYNLDNFVLTGSNEFALSVAKAIIKEPGKRYNPVFIHSGVGLGKTHLLQAIGQQILSDNPGMRIRYTTSEAFFNLFLSGIRNKNSQDFKNFYRDLDVLLVDDIQFIAGKDATQEAFFHNFNELHQNNKQIVITADRPPKQLDLITDRLVSRFEWGIVVDINQPSMEDRLAVLQDKVYRLGIKINESQILKIAQQVSTNFRDLEGVLNRIQARLQLLPDRIFEDYELEKILSGYINSAPIAFEIPQKNRNAESILDLICQTFDVKKSDLLSKTRLSNVAKARQVAMYLIKKLLNLSYPAVGKIFSRDHTTVIHGCRKLQKELKEDTQLQAKIASVEQQFGS